MTDRTHEAERRARLARTGFAAIATVVWLASFGVGYVATVIYGSDYRQGFRFALLINAGILALMSGLIARRVPVAGKVLLERRGRLVEPVTAADIEAARPTSMRTFALISFPLAFLAVIV